MPGRVLGMPLTFVGTLDRSAVTAAVDQLTELVGSAAVADAWEQESTLPGLTVGGLTRHLVSQPECAVEFLTTPGPHDVPVMTLVGHYERVDWLHAPVDAPENTSIRDDFNQMASAGHTESVEVLARSREQLAAAIAVAGPTTYVPSAGLRAADGRLPGGAADGDRGACRRPGVQCRRGRAAVRLGGT